MKSFLYNKKNLFLSVATAGLFLILSTTTTQAAYKVEIGLPGLPAGSAISDPGQYVKYLFIFGLSLAGFLAVAAIAYGGIKYMLAGASMSNLQDAKDNIWGALIGIGLLLGSYLLLYTIDPSLTNLSPRVPPAINIAEPEPGTRNCEPACQNGERCDGTTYTCVRIDVTAPEMIRNQTPNQCDEFETTGGVGCALGHKVWNPNTCSCEVCGGDYQWDAPTRRCVLK